MQRMFLSFVRFFVRSERSFLRSLIAATNARTFFLVFLLRRLSFVRPRRRLSSAPTVDFGRRRAQKLSRSAVALAIEAHFDVSRPRLDSFEHGGRLDDRGPKERSVVEFLPLLSVCFGALSFAGSSVDVRCRVR